MIKEIDQQTDKRVSLKEYNDNKLMDKIDPLTNIKCEKCDGAYQHVDCFTIYTCNPPQQKVVCDYCRDTQYIIV